MLWMVYEKYFTRKIWPNLDTRTVVLGAMKSSQTVGIHKELKLGTERYQKNTETNPRTLENKKSDSESWFREQCSEIHRR